MACRCRSNCTCVVTAGDGVTVTGNGSGAAPYVVSSAPVECSDVRPCFSAGDGLTYDQGTGEFAADLSSDAGNTTSIGSDGGLFTPPSAVVETACGLSGDGTAGDPLSAALEAGEEAWPWTGCTAPDASTVKCDPNTQQLWTPPEHDSDRIGIETFSGPATFDTPGDSPLDLQTMVFDYAATCRRIAYKLDIHSVWSIEWTDGAAFRLHYQWFFDGAGDGVYPLEGNVLPSGTVVPMDAGSRNFCTSLTRAGTVGPNTPRQFAYQLRVLRAPENTATITVETVQSFGTLLWSTMAGPE